METTIIPITIPVPPAPLLEQAVGYQNSKNVCFLALWWEPCGDEAMVSDGLVSFTGHWPGYLAYVQYHHVVHHLAACPLGSSEEPARMKLIIDLRERKGMVAMTREADRFLAAQWQLNDIPERALVMNLSDLETLVERFFQQPNPSMEEVTRRMEEDHQRVAALQHWLDALGD